MQQGAQLCFNGNFLVDRSEYPPLASRVLTSSGVAALPRRRDAYAQEGAQGHLSSEGLGGDPKHRGAIRPKPQCKLSRMSQLLTIYTNPPATSNLLRERLQNHVEGRLRRAPDALEAARPDYLANPCLAGLRRAPHRPPATALAHLVDGSIGFVPGPGRRNRPRIRPFSPLLCRLVNQADTTFGSIFTCPRHDASTVWCRFAQPSPLKRVCRRGLPRSRRGGVSLNGHGLA